MSERSELMEKMKKEKEIAARFQERRHTDWNDNYSLYRNKVKTNRITQRQSVNIPMMKETVKTLLAKIDEPPSIDWQELSGDEFKELILEEMWNDDFDRLNFEGIDVQDKKSTLLTGRSLKKLNWEDGFNAQVMDPFDVTVDPMTNPLDIETARFIVHSNIFRSLRDILADDRYSPKAKNRLKTWLTTDEGIVQNEKSREEYEKKIERLKLMGVNDSDFPLFAAGDVIVNLTEHITNIWNTQKQEFERRVVVYAEDTIELMDERLEDLLGMSEYPYVTWAEDIETSDFWSDGPADLVRVPNKVLNIWWSQLVENRTLRNFQMHWYDATQEGYTPQTYEPGPGKMLPAPGKPRDTIQPVDIQGLDETLTAIDFLTKLVEKGTSATAIEKGVSERKQITLGEVQTLVGKAMERTLAMAKFYRRSWYDLARKWLILTEANQTSARTLYKTDKEGKVWPKVVKPKDWKSDAGYRPIVRSSSEQEEEKTKGIQRFMFIRGMFPNNPALNRIIQQRSLELVDLTPAEMREVESAENQVQQQLPEEAQQEPQQMSEITRAAQELENLQNGT